MSCGLRALGFGLLALGSLAARQAPLPAPRSPLPAVEPGSELTVTLLTYEPGGRVWERFGHNALWIHDSTTGADVHYDYGRFSFAQPHFVLRFLQGHMWYSMGSESNVPGVIAAYVRAGRKVWEQQLELTAAQRVALRDFLAWNIQPEHAEYAYDPYRDNCSTRIRDALDRVVGGAIRRYAEQGSGVTWREETRRLNQHNAALYTGLMLALGQPADVEMSRWEQMFLPIRLREHLDSVRVPDAAGVARPLVRSERVIDPGGRWPVPERPANWALGYLVVGLLLGGGMAAAGRTRAFMPLSTLWALLSGLAGALLTWFWFFSQHIATHRNENLLLFNLLALALAVVLPSAVRGKAWAAKPARRLALVVAGLGVLALLVKLLPGFPQRNLELILLALPINIGLLMGLRRSLAGRIRH